MHTSALTRDLFISDNAVLKNKSPPQGILSGGPTGRRVGPTTAIVSAPVSEHYQRALLVLRMVVP